MASADLMGHWRTLDIIGLLLKQMDLLGHERTCLDLSRLICTLMDLFENKQICLKIS